MAAHTPSRRAVLGAIPALAVVPAISLPAAAASFDDGRWWRLHARYTAFKAQAQKFWQEVEDPMHAAYTREAGAIPHSTVTYQDDDGTTKTLSSANERHCQEAHFMAGNYVRPDERMSPYLAACVALKIKLDERGAALEAIQQRLDMDAICERSDKFSEALANFEWRLISMPASDPSALLWKLHHLFACDDHGSMTRWAGDFVAQTLADARRILGGEA